MDFIPGMTPELAACLARKAAAQAKADMYAKVAGELGDQISKLERDIDLAEELGRAKYNTYMFGEGTVEGDIWEDFKSAVNIWDNRYKNIISHMRNKLIAVRTSRSTAERLKENYETQVRMEEMMINGGF